MQVHCPIDVKHHVVEQMVGEALTPRPVGGTGERAIQVLAVLRIDVHRPLEEARPIQQRDDDDRTLHVLGANLVCDSQRGERAGVFGGVNASREQERQPRLSTDDAEVRPLVLAQKRVVEREVA